MNAENLKERTKKFALRIIKLVNSLPNNMAGRIIGNQIFRSGTSTASGTSVTLTPSSAPKNFPG